MRLARILAAATLAFGLAACGSSTDDASSTNADATTGMGDEFPVTIKHAYGSTTIEKAPTRVATIAWNQDTALALGVVPVGIAKTTYGDDDNDGLHPWVKDQLDKLGAETPELFDETDGINFDAVAATEPDLILAPNSGLTKEEYTTLTKITPNVIAYPDMAWGTSWRQAITMTAEALGKPEAGAEMITDLEGQIAEAVAKRPEIKGKSAVMSWIDPSDLSKVGYYTQGDARAAFLNDLGFATPGFVTAASKKSDSFYVEMPAENADELSGAEVFVGYGDQAGLKKAQADSLLGTIPAIKNGSVALLADNSPLAAAVSPSALSIPWMLDDYVALLGDAAAKVK